jgi:putative transposase
LPKELTPELRVSGILSFAEASQFQQAHREWGTEALRRELAERDDRWSEAVAVGSFTFVEEVKRELGVKAMHRAATEVDGTFTLREPREAYTSVFAGKNDVPRLDNSRFYEEKSEI